MRQSTKSARSLAAEDLGSTLPRRPRESALGWAVDCALEAGRPSSRQPSDAVAHALPSDEAALFHRLSHAGYYEPLARLFGRVIVFPGTCRPEPRAATEEALGSRRDVRNDLICGVRRECLRTVGCDVCWLAGGSS
jgi:hypothetical protein